MTDAKTLSSLLLLAKADELLGLRALDYDRVADVGRCHFCGASEPWPQYRARGDGAELPHTEGCPYLAWRTAKAAALIEVVPVHQFVVFGMPRTKKTSNKVAFQRSKKTGRIVPRVFPAKEWAHWCKTALIKFLTARPTRPLTERFSCRAIFYLTARQHGDACGYYQGLADLLERRGIPGVEERGLLKNDRQIVDWDRSRGPWHGPQYLDPARPRVEVELSPVQLSL